MTLILVGLILHTNQYQLEVPDNIDRSILLRMAEPMGKQKAS